MRLLPNQNMLLKVTGAKCDVCLRFLAEWVPGQTYRLPRRSGRLCMSLFSNALDFIISVWYMLRSAVMYALVIGRTDRYTQWVTRVAL